MDNPYNPSLIPVYLEAKTKDELIKMMLTNNVSNGKQYNYFCPVKDGRKWVVWYYADVKTDINLTRGRE